MTARIIIFTYLAFMLALTVGVIILVVSVIKKRKKANADKGVAG